MISKSNKKNAKFCQNRQISGHKKEDPKRKTTLIYPNLTLTSTAVTKHFPVTFWILFFLLMKNLSHLKPIAIQNTLKTALTLKLMKHLKK